MLRINELKIKTRIIALVVIPLIVTLTLAIERYKNAETVQTNIEKLDVLQAYIKHMSPLVAALQNEFLYSHLYIIADENDPTTIAFLRRKMQQARRPVDKALKSYIDFINSEQGLAQFPKLSKNLDRLKTKTGLLPELRVNADQKLKKVGNLWTQGTMRTTVLDLIETSKAVVILSSTNDELSLLSNAYQNLISAKNTNILQVSNIYLAIDSPMNVSNFGKIVKYQTAMQEFLSNYTNYAPAQLVDFYSQRLESHPTFKLMNDIQESVRRKATNSIGEKLDLNAEQWLTDGDNLTNAYDVVIDETLNTIEQTKNSLGDNAQRAVRNTLILIVGLVIVLALVSLKIISSINQPIQQLMNDLTQLAQSKDMSLRSNLQGNNELTLVGKAFNSLIEAFESTLSKVRNRIVEMTDSSQEVSDSMKESMRLIESQKDATESISVAINQMTTTIHEVSKMSLATSDTVKKVHNLSISSEKDAQLSKNSMDALFTELGDTGTLVENLNDEAGQISNILQVIKGISEQTNLLALNAAIEAARAGEAGRGFAVVADEVRELSKRTHESTEQIQSQIESLTSGASQASRKMQTLQESGHETADTVQKSTNAFLTIIQELDQITDMANQIAVASEEQTNAADEINQRILSIKADADNMHHQGLKTLASTNDMLENGSTLKQDIDVFSFK